MTESNGLTLPLGRKVVLPGRGDSFVREAGSPSAAHQVLLVHGWFASGGLNWAAAFAPLSEHFRVVAPDLRGHGRGIRSRKRFRLEDCADDLAALLENLGSGPAIVVGYSMGGLVAQLLWRRRPDLVSGLVLCATTRAFVPGHRQRYLVATTMNYAAGTVSFSRLMRRMYTPPGMPRSARLRFGRPTSMRVWAAGEMRRHDMRQIFEAGHATTRFNSTRWIGEVDVPTAVVVTTKDHAIPPDDQRQLAASINGARIFPVEDDHTASGHASFAPVLVDACRDVATRIEAIPPK